MAVQKIQLRIRGKTISVIPEGAQKAIRLRTLGLDADELMRLIDGISPEEWSQEQGVAQQIVQDAAWLRERRAKNREQADAAILETEMVLEDNGALMDQLALKRSIKKNLYIQRDLKTEQDKLERLLDRWKEYDNTPDLEQKAQIEGYIRYCGFDPESRTDYDELLQMHDMTVQTIKHMSL